jgi:hypothetical protein
MDGKRRTSDGADSHNTNSDPSTPHGFPSIPSLSSMTSGVTSQSAAASTAASAAAIATAALVAPQDRVVKVNLPAIIQTLKHLRGADRASKGLTGLVIICMTISMTLTYIM